MYLSRQDSMELEEKYYCPCKDVHASHICLHSFYIIASTVGYVNFRLLLAKGICLLPLQRLNSMLLQLLTFHTPWRGFRVESDALCAPGKLVEQVFRQLDIFRNWFHNPYPSVQFSSVAKSCPTICDPMDCCTQSFPALYHLPKFAQVHAHWVCKATSNHLILSCPLLSQSLHLLISKKALNPFLVTSAPHD